MAVDLDSKTHNSFETPLLWISLVQSSSISGFLMFAFVVLEPVALQMPGKYFTTELYPECSKFH